ncbi:hypothetical protein HYY69_03185 [Candidatus Woesearchaeota archaeon]|nr:hypothetical protein [Candidatus Woesearchaeota archaeon]
MAPAMAHSLYENLCQTTVVKIKDAGWGYDPLLSQYGLHIKVPIPDAGRKHGGSKTFLFQDAQKIGQLMRNLGATDAAQLVNKQVVVYFDPRFGRYSNPVGLSAPSDLEKYVRQITRTENRSALEHVKHYQ